jgi:hypothetical protein
MGELREDSPGYLPRLGPLGFPLDGTARLVDGPGVACAFPFHAAGTHRFKFTVLRTYLRYLTSPATHAVEGTVVPSYVSRASRV